MNPQLGDTRLIIDLCKQYGCFRNQAAYILATAYWETARTMKPVRETLAKTDKQAIERLDRAWAKGQLKWVKSPYWRSNWFGRGYVQLTHERNYRKAQEELGVPFHDNPATALESGPAAKVLVFGSMEGWFTGKKIGDYITLQKSDFRSARRVINGTDKATEIARLAKDYDEALEAEGYGVADAKPIAVPTAKPKLHKSLIESKEMIGGLTALIAAVTAFLDQFEGQTTALILGAVAVGFIANRLYARWKDER